MPLVRKEDTDELLSEAAALLDQGALHQALGALLTLARRLARSGREAPELERVAGAIGETLRRQDLVGMTAEEEAQLREALEAVHGRLASLG